MPNVKSAIKKVKVARAKTLQNTAQKSALKTAIKKCKEAINQNDENVLVIFNETMKIIDKAAAKHVIHKNTAARKKSKLAKALSAVSK
ncbi:MAG: 30S ribosomal protein S20 [Acetivibrionales bacterium]